MNMGPQCGMEGKTMEQKRSLDTISDGKIYDIDDWVCADANGCAGCSACCHEVGDLVMLTPYDAFEICRHLDCDFDALLGDKIVLRKKQKLRLPYLGMQAEDKRCSFLNEADRCSIHAHRPNICRLFPLGRVYEKDDFKYFLQVNNCKKPQLSKVKVREWIGITYYDENKEMLIAWHELIKALKFRVKFVYDEAELERLNQILIDHFYRVRFEEERAFYRYFNEQLSMVKKELGIL